MNTLDILKVKKTKRKSYSRSNTRRGILVYIQHDLNICHRFKELDQ